MSKTALSAPFSLTLKETTLSEQGVEGRGGRGVGGSGYPSSLTQGCKCSKKLVILLKMTILKFIRFFL